MYYTITFFKVAGFGPTYYMYILTITLILELIPNILYNTKFSSIFFNI